VGEVLGALVPEDRLRAILEALGFEVAMARGPERRLAVTVPSWRGDVAREIDLVEEVGRHHGLHRINPTVPAARAPGGLRPFQARERRLRELLQGLGLTEAVNFGLVDGRKARTFDAPQVVLANPLSSDLDALRSSLLPGLLGDLETNTRQGRRDVALFEIGRVFAAGAAEAGLPREERRLGFVLSGALRPSHWSERAAVADFYAAKGMLEVLGERLGMPALRMDARVGLPAFLHPGRSALVESEGAPLGFVGVLHPDLRGSLDVREEVVVAEVSLEPWLHGSERPLRVRALDRFPAVARDLSLLCDAGLEAAELTAVIRGAGGEFLRGLEMRDRYEGGKLPPGKVGLTVGLRFQDQTRTLTGDEVQAAVAGIVAALHEQGVEIRGE
jgi:phenylalanyl-tRNA synthetase beta chain